MPVDNDLHKAAHKGDVDEVRKFVEGLEGEDAIDVNEPGAGDRRALHRSAANGFIEISEYLISKGATVDQPDKSGKTPLHWAVLSAQLEASKFLISKGASVIVLSETKNNSLHFACEKGCADIGKVLCDAAAAVSPDATSSLFASKNSDEKTPWDIAAGKKDATMCGTLKDAGDPGAAGSAACVIS